MADNKGASSRYMQVVHEALGNNLRNIVEITGARNQAEIAGVCGVDAATFNKCINAKGPLTLEMVISICENFGLPIDDFIYRDMRGKAQEQKRAPVDYDQYEGAYLACFRDTVSDKLKYGVLCICCDGLHESAANKKQTDVIIRASRLRTIAVFYDNQQAAQNKLSIAEEVFLQEKYSFEMLYKALEVNSTAAKEEPFFGSVVIDDSVISILLHSDYYSDDVMIKMLKTNQKRKYVGGVGLVISNVATSPAKGKRVPCAQKIILARSGLSIDEAYIDDALTIDYEVNSVAVAADWNGLARRVAAMIDTVSSGAEKSGFTEEDIITIIAGILQNACRQHINSNPLPFVLLSPADDRKGYEVIKLSKAESELR